MKGAAKVLVIGGVALFLTMISGRETISMWGPLVFIWTITGLMTAWVLAGEKAGDQRNKGPHDRAA